MLKKASFWGAIAGGLFIAGNLFNAAQLAGEPTSIQLINITQWTINLAWVLFGAFLVAIHFFRNSWLPILPDALDLSVESPLYSRRRDWTVAFVLIVIFLGSIEVWVLNFFASTSPLLHWQNVFDFLANIIFFYIAVQLFRGARPYRQLLYTTLVYGIGMIAIYAIREEWFSIIVYVLFMSYFIASALLPATRRNLVATQILLLPLYIVLTLAFPYVENRELAELNRKEAFLEQQFLTDTAQMSGVYQRLLTRERPDSLTMSELRTAIERRDTTTTDLREILTAIKDEEAKELRTIIGMKTQVLREYLTRELDIHHEQAGVLEQLLDYMDQVNFESMSSSQEVELSRLIQGIEEYNRKLADLSFEVDSTNLRDQE